MIGSFLLKSVLFRALIFCLCCLYLPFACKQSFKLPSSLSYLSYRADWETENALPKHVFERPFTYLARGNQCYVFENGEYVLKIFRYTRTRFPVIQKMKNWVHPKARRDLFAKLDKTFRAACLACTDGREFTQVLYCHLNLTRNQLPTIQLIDCLGRMHWLALDRSRFVIQKKTTPFKEALLEAKDNRREMCDRLDSLCALWIQRLAKGIYNSDPNLAPNFGFLHGCAVEIDFGNYLKSTDPQTAQIEIQARFSRLKEWLRIHAPEYESYIDSFDH